jgi:hypothetical protein
VRPAPRMTTGAGSSLEFSERRASGWAENDIPPSMPVICFVELKI